VHVSRGGGWVNSSFDMRAARRYASDVGRNAGVGMRVCVSPKTP
jgi:hypothetical protein